MKKHLSNEWKGTLPELPMVAVDCFKHLTFSHQKNSNHGNRSNHYHHHGHIECYFLSHAHSDHFPGLTNDFYNCTNTNNSSSNSSSHQYHPSDCSTLDVLDVLNDGQPPIYCSFLTRKLLLAKFPNLPPTKIIPLDVQHFQKKVEAEAHETSHQISLSGNRILHVTLLNANHCPGSVMFLFQSPQMTQTVLYTGDFRFESSYYDFSSLSSQQLLREKAFDANNEKNQKNLLLFQYLKRAKIDRIYLDATFCDPDFFGQFPTRWESIQQIIALITRERGSSSGRSGATLPPVYLTLEILGTEPMIIAIAKAFRVKVYIDHRNLRKNRCREMGAMEFLEPYITTDKSTTWLRIVSFDALKAMYELLKDESDRPVFIRATTMWIRQLYQKSMGVSMVPSHEATPKLVNGIWHVLFSIHCSFGEMSQFVREIVPDDGRSMPSIVALCADIASIQKSKDIACHFTPSKLKEWDLLSRKHNAARSSPTKCGNLGSQYDFAFMEECCFEGESSNRRHTTGSLSLDVTVEYTSPSSERNIKKQNDECDYDPDNLFSLLGDQQQQSSRSKRNRPATCDNAVKRTRN